MPASVAPKLDAAPRKMLSMRGETLRKSLADEGEAARKDFGRVLERMLQIAGMTKQQLARDLGYGDNQAPVSRWIAGVEQAPIARIWSLRRLRPAYIAAHAEGAQNEGVEVVTQINMRKAVGE